MSKEREQSADEVRLDGLLAEVKVLRVKTYLFLALVTLVVLGFMVLIWKTGGPTGRRWVLLILGGFVFAIIATVLSRKVERSSDTKRREALGEVARKLGFQFNPREQWPVPDEPGFVFDPADENLLPRELGVHPDTQDQCLLPAWLAGFQLFKLGLLGRATNVMQGTATGIDVAVFDYEYTARHGKDPTHNSTVIAFQSEKLNLPGFYLEPRVEHRRRELLRGGPEFAMVDGFSCQDIKFNSNPGFCRSYALSGSDEAALRAAFDDQVLSWYVKAAEGHAGPRPWRGHVLNAEGAGNTLILYLDSWYVIKPQDWPAFVEKGLEIFGLFARS